MINYQISSPFPYFYLNLGGIIVFPQREKKICSRTKLLFLPPLGEVASKVQPNNIVYILFVCHLVSGTIFTLIREIYLTVKISNKFAKYRLYKVQTQLVL